MCRGPDTPFYTSVYSGLLYFHQMRILTKRRLREFWEVHPAARAPLSNWHSAVEGANWTCFSDVRRTYNSADQVGDYLVFNANSFRVVVTVDYTRGRVFIYMVFTHSDYDRWSSANRKAK